MKLLSFIMLALDGYASLAAVVPLVENEFSVSTAPPAPLQKRADKWHFCGDDTWKQFSERVFLAGLRAMGGVHNDDNMWASTNELPPYYVGDPGWCTNVYCGDDPGFSSVVFYLCVRPEAAQKKHAPKDLAQKFHDGFHDCYGKREPSNSKILAQAFHVWDPEFSLHVEGGSAGLKCPEQINKKAFSFPDTLNHPPYVPA